MFGVMVFVRDDKSYISFATILKNKLYFVRENFTNVTRTELKLELN